jgi:hypothetical protein
MVLIVALAQKKTQTRRGCGRLDALEERSYEVIGELEVRNGISIHPHGKDCDRKNGSFARSTPQEKNIYRKGKDRTLNSATVLEEPY